MLNTNLSTSSVTKHTVQSGSGQNIDQTSQVLTAPYHSVQSRNVVQQTLGSATTVVTENISTPKAESVRYDSIKTTQRSASGQDFDFSKVLNVWGKADFNSQNPYNTSSTYSRNVFGVVPVANLPLQQRQALLNQINGDKVYAVDYSKTTRQNINGHPAYSYAVSLSPVAYIKMLKALAADLGLRQLDQLDPSRAANAQPVSLTFEVDVWSGELLAVKYEGNSQTENYKSYGQNVKLSDPSPTIPLSDLQNRLQQIQ